MDTTQRLIIALMKAAVTGEAQTLPQGYSLEEAMPIIKKQGLATLAYEGGVLCGISRNDPNMQILFKLYYQILLHSERQMQKVEEIYKAFEENGIDYLPFKGCVLKALYPKPELRPMGDADILIRFEQYPKTKLIMAQMGFQLMSESECELVWEHPSLHLELHRNIFHPAQKDLYAYYGDGWRCAVHQSGNRYTFKAEDSFIQLFVHFVKHYRCGGIGCRHVLDLWIYSLLHPEMDWNYLKRELEELHLLEFYENMQRLIQVWFVDEEADEKVQFMTQRIFSGGTYGNSKDYHVFVALMGMKEQKQIKNGKLRYYRNICFPGIDQMCKKYPILERYPGLLPVAWGVRGMTVLFGHREKLANVANSGKFVSDETLNAHMDALRFVGLDVCGNE